MVAQIDRAYIRHRPAKVLTRLLSYALFEGRPLTTRGRWLNPMVFGIHGLAKRLHLTRAVDRPVFIVGTGRSGTTILGKLMSMHRDVGFLNEPKALWHSAVPNEDLIGNYGRDEAYYRLGATEASPQVKEDLRSLYAAYLLATGARRVVDKYPELVFRVPFVRAVFPDAKFLFIVRNGWDTCASIDLWSQRLGKRVHGEQHDWWGADRRKWRLLVEQVAAEDPDLGGATETLKTLTNQTDMAAVEWILTMREGTRMAAQYPGSFLTLAYEALVEEPERVLGEVLEFLGLPRDPVFFQYAEEVLTPATPKPAFELHPVIQAPFQQTMRALGYETPANGATDHG